MVYAVVVGMLALVYITHKFSSAGGEGGILDTLRRYRFIVTLGVIASLTNAIGRLVKVIKI